LLNQSSILFAYTPYKVIQFCPYAVVLQYMPVAVYWYIQNFVFTDI